MLTRRLQVLIDDERYERLAERSARRKVSVAELVREAIDEIYPSEASVQARRRRAADAILAAEPMPVGDPDELKKELDEIRSRRHWLS